MQCFVIEPLNHKLTVDYGLILGILAQQLASWTFIYVVSFNELHVYSHFAHVYMYICFSEIRSLV